MVQRKVYNYNKKIIHQIKVLLRMETNKVKALAQICKLMRGAGFTVNDVKRYAQKHENELADEYDILCLIDGRLERVAFSLRHLGKPIGIFPFPNEPEYIELDEVESKKHTDTDVEESRLLDEQFCSRVYKIKDNLNVYLETLGKPVLEGVYLADNSYMHGCGWLVGFDDNETHNISSDYFGGNEPAKLRYMGRFNGSNHN